MPIRQQRGPLRIQEEDNNPFSTPVILKVSNGTLTDNGDGTFSLATGGGGGGTWGTITGTLSDQTDLQTALDAKLSRVYTAGTDLGISLTSGVASVGNPGGDITLTGGAGNTTGDGGALNFTGGAAGNSAGTLGGQIAFVGGAGGSGATGNGGKLRFLGGNSNATNGAGGALEFIGGIATGNATGGSLTFQSGDGAAAGAAGNIEIFSGDPNGGTPGAITIGSSMGEAVEIGSAAVFFPGQTASTTEGSFWYDTAVNVLTYRNNTADVQLFGGGIGGSTGSVDNALLRANGTGGSTLQPSGIVIGDDDSITFPDDAIPTNRLIQITAQTTADTAGNTLAISSANGNGTGDGGALFMASGNAGVTSGNGGTFGVISGDGVDTGNGGALNLATGTGGSAGGNGGSMGIALGDGQDTGDGGELNIISGNSGDGATGNGGEISIGTGSALSTEGSGGDFNIALGDGTGPGTGGGFFVIAGQGGEEGNGGALSLSAGDSGATSGVGGAASLTAGSALGGSGAGGTATITGGNGQSSDPGGNVVLQAGHANESSAGNGGNVNIIAGNPGSTGGAGGSINITATAGGGGDDGDIVLIAPRNVRVSDSSLFVPGQTATTDQEGALWYDDATNQMKYWDGSSARTMAGDLPVYIAPAGTGGGDGTSVIIVAGDADDEGEGGSIGIAGGESGAGATGISGSCNFAAGTVNATNGDAGSINFTGRSGKGTGAGTSINFSAGASEGASGTAGNLQLNVGNANGGTAGQILFGNNQPSNIVIGTTSKLKLGQTATTAEGYIWYDNTEDNLKYRDDAITRTVATAPGAATILTHTFTASNDTALSGLAADTSQAVAHSSGTGSVQSNKASDVTGGTSDTYVLWDTGVADLTASVDFTSPSTVTTGSYCGLLVRGSSASAFIMISLEQNAGAVHQVSVYANNTNSLYTSKTFTLSTSTAYTFKVTCNGPWIGWELVTGGLPILSGAVRTDYNMTATEVGIRIFKTAAVIVTPMDNLSVIG